MMSPVATDKPVFRARESPRRGSSTYFAPQACASFSVRTFSSPVLLSTTTISAPPGSSFDKASNISPMESARLRGQTMIEARTLVAGEGELQQPLHATAKPLVVNAVAQRLARNFWRLFGIERGHEMKSWPASILRAAKKLCVEIIHVRVHAFHAQTFKFVHPPRFRLHGLMEIYPVVKIIAQRHAHDPQPARTKMLLHVFNHRRQVAFVDVFHDLPIGNDIKLQRPFSAGKFPKNLERRGQIGGEKMLRNRPPFSALEPLGKIAAFDS